MVMNSSSAEYSVLLDFELEPEIFSISSLQSFMEFCAKNELRNYPIHLKVDTGMHRLGVEPDEVPFVLDTLKNSDHVRIVSVFSHLFASDDPDLSLSRAQISEFEKVREKFDKALDYKVLYHILNSSGISRLPEASYDMVRLGIGLYGHTADRQMAERLLPVLAWHTRISQIKQVKAGETVGYGGRMRLEVAKSIAVIPVGYADGLSRALGNGVGEVYIMGTRCPFIGNICMDMSMVDVTGINCREGSGVELIGEHISLEHMARAMGTIPYEVLTSIPPRIKRHYIFNG
jgi:alanine racemase